MDVGKYISIETDPNSGAAIIKHKATGLTLKRYSCVVGFEAAAMSAAVSYAGKAVQLTAVDWDTDDPDSLFPFNQKYLDQVGFGEKSVEEISAELMEKLMRGKFNESDIL